MISSVSYLLVLDTCGTSFLEDQANFGHRSGKFTFQRKVNFPKFSLLDSRQEAIDAALNTSLFASDFFDV
jgi:hypothetical protein